MGTMTDFYFHRALPVLRRKPVLTALMVYSAGICVAVSIAALAVWRETSKCPDSQRFEQPYVVQAGAWHAPTLISTGALT
jgi:hypothetical protein